MRRPSLISALLATFLMTAALAGAQEAAVPGTPAETPIAAPDRPADDDPRAPPGEAAGADEESAKKRLPGYGSVMLLEALAPGSGLLLMGMKREGAIAMGASLPLIVAGQGLIWSYYLWLEGGIERASSDDYYFDTAARDPRWDWALGLGLCLDAGGRAIGAYSALAAHRAWMKASGDPSAIAEESPLDLLRAPFSSAALAPDVLPFVLLLDAASLPLDAPARARAFFEAEYQPFWGREMPPAGALAAKVLTAAFFSLSGSIGRELVLRGLVLERDGTAVSVFASCAGPALTIAVPGKRVSDAMMASLSGAALGWYAAALAKGDGGRLRKPIAFRFWLDFGRSVIGYVMDPESRSGPEMGFSVLYL